MKGESSIYDYPVGEKSTSVSYKIAKIAKIL